MISKLFYKLSLQTMAAVAGAEVAQKLAGNVAFVAAVAGGIYYIFNYTEIGTVWKAILNPGSTIEKIGDEGKELFGKAKDFVEDKVEPEVKEIVHDVEEDAEEAGGAVENFFKKIGNGVKENIIDPTRKTWEDDEEKIKDIAETVGDGIKSAWDSIFG